MIPEWVKYTPHANVLIKRFHEIWIFHEQIQDSLRAQIRINRVKAIGSVGLLPVLD